MCLPSWPGKCTAAATGNLHKAAAAPKPCLGCAGGAACVHDGADVLGLGRGCIHGCKYHNGTLAEHSGSALASWAWCCRAQHGMSPAGTLQEKSTAQHRVPANTAQHSTAAVRAWWRGVLPPQCHKVLEAEHAVKAFQPLDGLQRFACKCLLFAADRGGVVATGRGSRRRVHPTRRFCCDCPACCNQRLRQAPQAACPSLLVCPPAATAAPGHWACPSTQSS